MAKASDNAFPKLILVEGTTPASPSAGQQKLFVDSTSHTLKLVNSSGTVTGVGGSSGNVSVTKYTGGDITCTTATTWSNVSGIGTVTLSGVAAGDKVIVTPTFFTGSENATVVFDISTEVASSPVNSVASQSAAQTGTPTGAPGAWTAGANVSSAINGPSAPYTLLSGDISSGSVTFRLRHYGFAGTAKTIKASTSQPAFLSAYKIA